MFMDKYPYGHPDCLDYTAIDRDLQKEDWYYDCYYDAYSRKHHELGTVVKSVWIGYWGLQKHQKSHEIMDQEVKALGYTWDIEMSYGNYNNMYAQIMWDCGAMIRNLYKARDTVEIRMRCRIEKNEKFKDYRQCNG